MNIAAVIIAYFGIKETQSHPDTCAWRGQYVSKSSSEFLITNQPPLWGLFKLMILYIPVVKKYFLCNFIKFLFQCAIMARFHFPRFLCCQHLKDKLSEQWYFVKLTYWTLFYNSHTSFSVCMDTALEPLFWFVDRFVRYLGPVSIKICG